MASSIALFGQADSLKQTEQYIEFKVTPKGFFDRGDGFNIDISFGQKYLSNDSVIRVKTIKKVTSFSKIEDVFEFMNAMGWKLVTAYSTSHDRYYTFYYILKRTL